MLRGGGAMNSGPTASAIVSRKIRSISAWAGSSSRQPVGVALGGPPPNRGGNAPFPETLRREPIEPLHGGKILRESWLLEFWVGAAKIIALEFAVRRHPAGEETAAQRAIAKCRDPVLAAIGQDIGIDCALEQIVGRLQHMQRRHAPQL